MPTSSLAAGGACRSRALSHGGRPHRDGPYLADWAMWSLNLSHFFLFLGPFSFTPIIIRKKSTLASLNYRKSQINSFPIFLNRTHDLSGCFSMWFFFFFFYIFILDESLKNHNKLQKNHKIENLILLDST